DGVANADFLVAQELRHQLQGVLELGVEVVLGEGHLGGREGGLFNGGDLVGRDDDRTVRVGADFEVAAVLALVHVGVHVANDRVGNLADRVREEWDRPDADHLVHDRRQRDRGAGHARDAWAPHAAANGDDVGVDVAGTGAHGPDTPAVFGEVDAEDLGVGSHLQGPQLLGLFTHERARAQRIDDADGGKVQALHDDLGVEVRHQSLDLAGAQQLVGDAPGRRGGGPSAQLLTPRLGAGDFH